MHILMATSEVVPFAKTGGLADVCGALPLELARLGHQVTLFMPAYRQSLRSGRDFMPTDFRLDIPIGANIVTGRLLESSLPGDTVKVYLIEQDGYFDRPGLYGEAGLDYKDNCERFVFFCRSVLESIRLLGLKPDVVHAHDWQTSLLPAYLKIEYSRVNGYADIASLLTIHNMGYQGHFWHWDMALTGLDWKYFNWRQMEFYGNLSFLKTAIVFADAVTTVSPTYAREILSAPLGCGLEGTLQHRVDDLSGIINGVDYDVWNPTVDRYLGPNCYSVHDFTDGKARCKADIQERSGLDKRPDVPLLAAIGRLADQKGFDLITRTIRHWAERVDAQWIILGTGEPKYHDLLTQLAREFPDKIAVRLEFSDELAHRIEAGADIFVMPSQYEPCGLNQLYSLQYGTVPVVRATGGLVDTVVDANEQTLADGTATGFKFEEYTSLALAEALERALAAYGDKTTWIRLVEAGMRQDWSWGNSAQQYAELYERTVARGPLGIE